MAKNFFDIRLGVKRKDGYTSNIWRLWVTQLGDVYLAVRSMGGINKYSFHVSGICRNAFTKEYGTPSKSPDRLIFKWRRSITPIQNLNHVSRIAWIAFPTDFLSRNIGMHSTKVAWVEAAANGGATYFELGYTLSDEESVRRVLSSNQQRTLINYVNLPTNEGLLIMYYHADWDNKDLKSPGDKESHFKDLLFSANDPDNTGRPVRMIFGPTPSDGDALILQEIGGYQMSFAK